MLRPPLIPRRVLMSCDAVGGVWRHAVDLARGLAGHGVETVLLGSGPRPRPETLEADAAGLTVEWLDRPLPWMAADEAALDGLPKAIAAIARRHGVDLVHLAMAAEADAIPDDLPVVVGAHSCLLTWWRALRSSPPPAEWDWKIARDRRGYARAEAILSPSAAHAAAMRAAYGPLDGLAVVHNAAADPPEPAGKKLVVVAAARWWDEAKNLKLLDAAARDGSWPVIAFGSLSGPGGARAEALYATMRGECPAADVRAAMAQAAVFVSPSLYEPFGLATLEAAHAGAALVLADIPTYRELWSGVAVFVDPHDPAALVAAVDRLMEAPGLRGRLAAAAARRAETYAPAAQARGVLDAYARVLARRARPAGGEAGLPPTAVLAAE